MKFYNDDQAEKVADSFFKYYYKDRGRKNGKALFCRSKRLN